MENNSIKNIESIDDSEQKLEYERENVDEENSKEEDEKNALTANKKGIECLNQGNIEDAKEFFTFAYLTCDQESPSRQTYKENIAKAEMKIKEKITKRKIKQEDQICIKIGTNNKVHDNNEETVKKRENEDESQSTDTSIEENERSAMEANKKGIQCLNQGNIEDAKEFFTFAYLTCDQESPSRQTYKDNMYNAGKVIREELKKKSDSDVKQESEKKAIEANNEGLQYLEQGKLEEAEECFSLAFFTCDHANPNRQEYKENAFKAKEILKFAKKRAEERKKEEAHKESLMVSSSQEQTNEESFPVLHLIRDSEIPNKPERKGAIVNTDSLAVKTVETIKREFQKGPKDGNSSGTGNKKDVYHSEATQNEDDKMKMETFSFGLEWSFAKGKDERLNVADIVRKVEEQIKIREIEKKAESGKQETRRKVTEAYKKGLEYFKRGLYSDARDNFLVAFTICDDDYPNRKTYKRNIDLCEQKIKVEVERAENEKKAFQAHRKGNIYLSVCKYAEAMDCFRLAVDNCDDNSKHRELYQTNLDKTEQKIREENSLRKLKKGYKF